MLISAATPAHYYKKELRFYSKIKNKPYLKCNLRKRIKYISIFAKEITFKNNNSATQTWSWGDKTIKNDFKRKIAELRKQIEAKLTSGQYNYPWMK